MRIAVIGASGKTGTEIVRVALDRGWEVASVCRDGSSEKLAAFAGRDGFSLFTAPVVSDEETLTRALDGCGAVVALLISVRRLKATELVASLERAATATGVSRFVFTAGEVTAVPEEGETLTLRQKILLAVFPLVLSLTPYSMTDMIEASRFIRGQAGWDWTIVRAPTLKDGPAVGYAHAEVSDVTSAHGLSRADYANALLDSVGDPTHHRRAVTVVGR